MMPGRSSIMFHYLVPPFYFPDRNKLKAFILEQIAEKGRKVDAINFIFCDDHYLLDINKKYLNHNTFTDIITFELSQPEEDMLADIFISVERVRENSLLLQTEFLKELLRVIFHGVLHLLGFKDKSIGESRQMRAQEDELLQKYFISRGTKLSNKH